MFLRRPLSDADIAVGLAGTEALRHRGPNSGGQWVDRDAGVFLGHRRLAILDLTEASNQPMVRERTVLSYNGEIYNARDLRRSLEAHGDRFISTGDTEVLLRAWQRHGAEALDRIDGMFGFALWDGESGWLAIDRFGEKSLYFAELPEGVVVSSELAALSRVLRLTPNMTAATLVPYLALSALPAPRTFYAEVRKLEPASLVRIRSGQAQTPRHYWRPPEMTMHRGKPQPLNERDLDDIQATLVESTRRRLEADVQPCLFLSSGVDSALVAAIAKRDLGQSPQCITVSFSRGKTHNEAEGARHIAEALDLPHVVLPSAGEAEAVSATQILDYFGQPLESLTVTSVHQMCATASQLGYRFGLTGLGGDEMFFGYAKHQYFYDKRHFFALPELLRRTVGAVSSPLRPASSALRALGEVFALPDEQLYLAVKNLPAIHALQRLPGFEEWARQTFDLGGTPIELHVPRYDLAETMPNSQLSSLDVGSMRASLELRTPFLSRELAETMARFDVRALLAFGQKSVLRRILARYLDRSLTAYPKRGFSFPSDQFLQHVAERPTVPSVPESFSAEVWARRDEPGWRRLAVRLVLASSFLNWRSAMKERTVSDPLAPVAAQ